MDTFCAGVYSPLGQDPNTALLAELFQVCHQEIIEVSETNAKWETHPKSSAPNGDKDSRENCSNHTTQCRHLYRLAMSAHSRAFHEHNAACHWNFSGSDGTNGIPKISQLLHKAGSKPARCSKYSWPWDTRSHTNVCTHFSQTREETRHPLYIKCMKHQMHGIFSMCTKEHAPLAWRYHFKLLHANLIMPLCFMHPTNPYNWQMYTNVVLI